MLDEALATAWSDIDTDIERIRAIEEPVERARDGAATFGRRWVQIVYGDAD